jgi:hypothetical protein
MTRQPSFQPESGGGLTVVDPIERHRWTLSTPGAVTPEPADTTQFRFPVDAAVSITTDALSFSSIGVHVRNESGTALWNAEHFGNEDFAAGQYTIEVNAPVKLYLRVKSAITASADAERIRIDFGDATDVVVGARSYHDHPAATVTTPAAPESMMQAVSTFGSALKMTSPERSYPTLRGHPPTIELGEELDLAGLDAPETGVTIELPAALEYIYPAVPFAYYLGAELVPGEDPLVRTNDGFVHSLEGPAGFERTVERTLKQVFFLDCLTRTEGLYPVNLHERRALESSLGLDFAALYDCSLVEQLEAYLAVPFAVLEDHLPEWKLTLHVEPTPTSVEMLPFVADDLPVVRCENPAAATDPAETVAVGGNTQPAIARNEAFTRGTSTNAPTETDSAFVKPESTESLEQAWVGEGTPLGASKATVKAYENRLNRTPVSGDIDITVVCNDAGMDEERGLIDEIYGDHEELAFDVTVERDLTTAELTDVLSTQTDLLHYVGHVHKDGFECADGKLDTTTLDSVGVDAFLLNACQSYRQGMGLIDAGAIGGIVTLSDVLNSEAVTMGRTLAGLLNCGFPLRAALEIARDESHIGDDYLVLGDGNLSIAQTQSGTANLLSVERNGESFDLICKTYPSANAEMGTVIRPLRDEAEYRVAGGEVRERDFSREELKEFLSLEHAPVRIDGELHWSHQIEISDL